MTNAELKHRLYKVEFSASMNARYHQWLERFWCWSDRAIKISVGALAVAGLYYATPGKSAETGFAVAVWAVIVAVALNVIDVGGWEKRNGELFRLWCELRKDAVLADHKTCDLDDEHDAVRNLCDRLNELSSKEESLHASQPAPINRLLNYCMRAELRSRYGDKVTTSEQAEAMVKEQLAKESTSASVGAGTA